MNPAADEKLRQAVREWIAASPAASACLLVESRPGAAPVFVIVGTEAQIRAQVARPPVK